MRITAALQQTGGTTTGFQIAPEVVEALGGGRRPKVTATVNGYSWRSSIAVMSGAFWLGMSAENRSGAGVAGGQVLELDVELDTAPRVVEPPADLAAALTADPAAAAAWTSLSYSHQRAHVTAIEAAKTEATRQRRVAGVLDKLRGG